MKFSDFVGNEKVKQQLSYLVESSRLPHAIIIEGEQGIGKRTFARELVLNLFCRNDYDKPCRICAQCSKVIKGIHPDIYEYSAPGGVRSFHIDVIRDIKEDVYMQPNEAEYKVYILGNCQCMGEPAQNALLKILEEPPSYALFILTVTTKSALLETVLSRSVVISLEGVDNKIAAEYICSKNESVDYDDAFNAASVWSGNIGKAVESLNNGKFSKINEIAQNICKSLLAENEFELLKSCSVFEKDRETLISVMNFLKSIFRDAIIYNDTSEILSGQLETAKMLSSRLSREKIIKLIYACENVCELAEKNGNNAILITKICYELRRAQNR